MPEFVNDEMLVAGEAVLRQSIHSSNPREIAAKVFLAMAAARDERRERKDRELFLGP